MEWYKNCEDKFQRLKTLLTTVPILELVIEGKSFIIYYDASHSCFGFVLVQDKNAIAYASRQLNLHEKIYLTHDLELVVMLFSLRYGGIIYMGLSVKYLLIIVVCKMCSLNRT